MAQEDFLEGFRRMHRAMRRMTEEMDSMFSSEMPLPESKAEELRLPAADVRETETKVVAAIELPGVEKKDIELNVTEHRIEVMAGSRAETEVKKKGSHVYAVQARQFYRSIPLPAEIRPEEAQAEYKDGMLRIEAPKAKSSKARKITFR